MRCFPLLRVRFVGSREVRIQDWEMRVAVLSGKRERYSEVRLIQVSISHKQRVFQVNARMLT